MTRRPTRLLLLEDNPGDYRLVVAKLADAAPGTFDVVHVERLADALARLDDERFDVMLSDLSVPDSDRLNTISQISARVPTLPLVAFTGGNDDLLGSMAIQQGAQDYLIKSDASGALIVRTLCFAMERKRLELALRDANANLERKVAERTAKLEDALVQLNESFASARALAETASDAIIVTDHDGIILSWNRAAEHLFGHAETDVVGQPLTLIIPEQFRDQHTAGMKRVRDGGTRHVIGQTVELQGLTKAGMEFPIELSLSAWATSQGMHFSGIIRDITERKRAAFELEKHREHLEFMVEERTRDLAAAKNAAEAASIAKSDFLANMSHEIRTPMNGILGMASILRREGVTPRQAERLDRIDTAAQHLLGVINDILDLSKIEADKLALENADVNIEHLIANVVSMLLDRVQAKGLQLLVESEPLPPGLVGDPTRLQQCLLNLANNALKFTDQGSITLSIRKLEETAAAVLLRFEVRDTGMGIDSGAVSRIFSAFEQADNSTTRKYGGTGLGLAITQRLAELMQGNVGAESQSGQGSAFWFTARLGKSAATEEAAPSPTKLDAETEMRTAHAGRQVLVVDDDALNREVALMLLEDVGLIVDTAEDGEEAVSKMQQAAYAIILMDMQMPKLDGLAATRHIRALPDCAQPPILAMTANAFVEDKQRCFDAGMNDFITKPFNPDVFFAILLKWLNQPQNG